MFKEAIANVDPETGISYGVINTNSLADWVLDQIQACGTDIDFEDAKEELTDDIKRAVNYTDVVGSPAANVLACIEELVDACLENYENDRDQVRYRYETEHEGKPLVVQMTGGSELFVFKSPVTNIVAQCSPCFPNAGDLDSPRPEEACSLPPFVLAAGGIPYGANVTAYGLPADWLRKADAE